MVVLDAYFGSANLADGANMFHIKPDAILPGDALVERWAKQGIGHTLPVMTAVKDAPNHMSVTLASGSMPRRQAVWEEPGQSAHYFSQDNTGGPGEAYDGTPYAKLGGGLRRWRTAMVQAGRWVNIVPESDRNVWIKDDDLAGISARPEQFRLLLAEQTPEGKRDAALGIIQSARNNLRQFPASCSSRTKREEGFALLYEAMSALGKGQSEVNAEYRTLEDYVFSELEYTQSKTCCWNSTNAAMGEIVIDYAAKEKARNEAAGTCRQPTVFASRTDGYELWKAHAASMGRSADWKAWREDEPCAQRDVREDAIGAHGKYAMCQ
jgi:hypothetical protein